jgi:hypothetical protein
VEDQSGNLLIQDAAPLHLGSCSSSLLFIDYPTHADATAESLPFNATVLLRSPVALSGGDTCGLGPADHGATAVMNSSDSDLDLLPLPHATHARKKEKKSPRKTTRVPARDRVVRSRASSWTRRRRRGRDSQTARAARPRRRSPGPAGWRAPARPRPSRTPTAAPTPRSRSPPSRGR